MRDKKSSSRVPSERNPEPAGRRTGFVDAHVHVHGAAGLDAVSAAGVVAVRDAGIRNKVIRVMYTIDRDAGPVRVISACRALYKKGGYGTSFGMAVETLEEFKSAIHLLKDAGAGIIKAMASGLVSLKNPGTVTAGGFNRDELRLIIQEAAVCGLGVMVHANGEGAVIDAAEAGARSIEHGFFMSIRALEVMAKKSTFWVPTVGALARAADTNAVPDETRDFVDGLIASHLEMLHYAHGIGVPLAIGTDCVLPDRRYADAYENELAYFEQAGIPHDEVRKIAGEGGAGLLGIGT